MRPPTPTLVFYNLDIYVRNKLIFLIGLLKKFEIVLKCVKNDVIYILWVDDLLCTHMTFSIPLIRYIIITTNYFKLFLFF